jgi:zinc/manganese transport system substrate-binding protein
VLAAAGVVLSACASAAAGPPPGHGRPIEVVAAEDVWGSIAAQVGGDRVEVTSIIDNPAADPHDYEPTAADGRTIATADVVLSNGIGYDRWAQQLAAANPDPRRVDLTVGGILGVRDGANPHRWYDPADVFAVAQTLAATFRRVDPSGGGYFERQLATFETAATDTYRGLVAQIRSRFAGTPVGASESIVAMLTPALGLDLVTPTGFLTAISEGTDPTAADKAAIDRQIVEHRIDVYVANRQNETPDVQVQVADATAHGIPVVTITETMVPAASTWQRWQSAELVALRDALAEATGR